MSSQKFTMADVEQEEVKWRTMVAENEIRLLKIYAKQGPRLGLYQSRKKCLDFTYT
jgi:hypothetical protein